MSSPNRIGGKLPRSVTVTLTGTQVDALLDACNWIEGAGSHTIGAGPYQALGNAATRLARALAQAAPPPKPEPCPLCRKPLKRTRFGEFREHLCPHGEHCGTSTSAVPHIYCRRCRETS